MAMVDWKVPGKKGGDPTGRERRWLIQALTLLDSSVGPYTLESVKSD